MQELWKSLWYLVIHILPRLTHNLFTQIVTETQVNKLNQSGNDLRSLKDNYGCSLKPVFSLDYKIQEAKKINVFEQL
eukprot:snap_masked-scaffold_11-processed-gene-8.23-mRNA-1 protein AED:1.00 eAED:1.00 QI:0/0/0/0/1/1/2/0/76